jgi:hypothetical protein
MEGPNRVVNILPEDEEGVHRQQEGEYILDVEA